MAMSEVERRTRARAAYLWQKYGLRPDEYDSMAWNGCQACGNLPKPGRSLHVDHEHVRGYKTMSPEDKRKYVRGVLCWTCNSVILRRGVTAAKLRSAADYLDLYTERKMRSHA